MRWLPIYPLALLVPALAAEDSSVRPFTQPRTSGKASLCPRLTRSLDLVSHPLEE